MIFSFFISSHPNIRQVARIAEIARLSLLEIIVPTSVTTAAASAAAAATATTSGAATKCRHAEPLIPGIFQALIKEELDHLRHIALLLCRQHVHDPPHLPCPLHLGQPSKRVQEARHRPIRLIVVHVWIHVHIHVPLIVRVLLLPSHDTTIAPTPRYSRRRRRHSRGHLASSSCTCTPHGS